MPTTPATSRCHERSAPALHHSAAPGAHAPLRPMAAVGRVLPAAMAAPGRPPGAVVRPPRSAPGPVRLDPVAVRHRLAAAGAMRRGRRIGGDTTLGGRVWCGLACAQKTVWSQAFVWLERRFAPWPAAARPWPGRRWRREPASASSAASRRSPTWSCSCGPSPGAAVKRSGCCSTPSPPGAMQLPAQPGMQISVPLRAPAATACATATRR